MQKLSLRKYAALIGVSHTAVAKAIQAGYIVKGIDPETKKIIVEIANAEWGNEIKKRNAANEDNTSGNKQANDKTLSGEDTSLINGDISFTEARRRKEIYNAEIARIEALKVNGLYVEKEKVYKELFAFGQQIRTAMLLIPNRVIDNILAAKARHEAYQILQDAIYEVLTQLTTLPEIQDK